MTFPSPMRERHKTSQDIQKRRKSGAFCVPRQPFAGSPAKGVVDKTRGLTVRSRRIIAPVGRIIAACRVVITAVAVIVAAAVVIAAIVGSDAGVLLRAFSRAL